MAAFVAGIRDWSGFSLTGVAHHQFSVEQYEQMVEAGILTESDRVELIYGEIVQKMTIGDRHAASVNWLASFFIRLVANAAIVSIQNPIRLAQSVPEPDIALLLPRADFYAARKPLPDEVLLLIEVADSSLEFDRNIKRRIYAAAGVRELWIVNLLDNCVEVDRKPRGDGNYELTQSRRGDDPIEIEALPGFSFTVKDLLLPVERP